MIGDTVTTPTPHDMEQHSDFVARYVKHATVARAYPTPCKRHLAAERQWAKAKRESLVSVKTSAGEVLLFGRLD